MPLRFTENSTSSDSQVIKMIEENNVTALQNRTYGWDDLLKTLSYKQRIETEKKQVEMVKDSLGKLSTEELSAAAASLSASEAFLREVEALWPAQQADTAEDERLSSTSGDHSEIVAHTKSAFDMGVRAGDLLDAFTQILYRMTTIFSTLQKYKHTDAAQYYINNAAMALDDVRVFGAYLPNYVIKALPDIFLEALEQRLEEIPLALFKLDIPLDQEMVDKCLAAMVYPEHRGVLSSFLSNPKYKNAVSQMFLLMISSAAIVLDVDLLSLLLAHKSPDFHIDNVVTKNDIAEKKDRTLFLHMVNFTKHPLKSLKEKCIAVLDLLLKAGADITKLDHKGNSALMLAMESEEPGVVLLLLEQYTQLKELSPMDRELLSILSTTRFSEVQTAANKVLDYFSPLSQALRKIEDLTEQLVKQEEKNIRLEQRLTLLENQIKLSQPRPELELSTPVGFISPQALRKSPPSPRTATQNTPPATENTTEGKSKPQSFRNV